MSEINRVESDVIGMRSERSMTRDQIETALFRWHESLDRPTMTFTEWYYGRGGLKDALDVICGDRKDGA